MFIGTYYYNMDDKGRVALPAKYREALSKGEVYLNQTIDKSIGVYTEEGWEAFTKKMTETMSDTTTNRKSRKIARFFLSGANSLELDKQGRVLVPVSLREFASLDKEVVIVGMNDHLEIWDARKFEEVDEDFDVDDIEAFLTENDIRF